MGKERHSHNGLQWHSGCERRRNSCSLFGGSEELQWSSMSVNVVLIDRYSTGVVQHKTCTNGEDQAPSLFISKKRRRARAETNAKRMSMKTRTRFLTGTPILLSHPGAQQRATT